jgi:hypothetical protein
MSLSEPSYGVPLLDVAAGYALSFGVYFMLNGVFRKGFGDDDILGSPRWSWVLCATGQVVVFPALVFLALSASGQDAVSYVTTAVDPRSAASTWERAFLYCIAGQFVKDFAVPMKRMYIIHHIVSISAVSLFWLFPGGLRACMIGTTLMELGSASWSYFVVRPGAVRGWVTLVVMTKTNVVALALCGWLMQAHTSHFLSWFMLIVTVGLIYMRQGELVKRTAAHIAWPWPSATGDLVLDTAKIG